MGYGILPTLTLITEALTYNKARIINWEDRCRGEITVMTTALEIRTEFLEHRRPMFEVVGPWDHDFQ